MAVMKEKMLYWVPRVLTILAISFMMLFSFDVFGGGDPLLRQLLGFLMHNIPAFILIGILLVAWKWEMAGGVLFKIATLACSVLFRAFSGNPGALIVLFPFLIVGILFILHHHIYNKPSE
jgi:hypothetical protein